MANDGLPEHIKFPLTKDGRGPADGDDFDHWGCWCSDPNCVEWKTDPITAQNSPSIAVYEEARRWGVNLSSTACACIAEAAIAASGLREEDDNDR